MSKKLVHEILIECVEQQMMANAGGVIGGKESEKLAEKDLKRCQRALDWYETNILKI